MHTMWVNVQEGLPWWQHFFLPDERIVNLRRLSDPSEWGDV